MPERKNLELMKLDFSLQELDFGHGKAFFTFGNANSWRTFCRGKSAGLHMKYAPAKASKNRYSPQNR